MIFEVTVNGRDYRVELEPPENESSPISGWKCRVNGEAVTANAACTDNGVLSLLIGGLSYEVVFTPGKQQLAIGGDRFTVEVRDPRAWRTRRPRTVAGEGPKQVVAPMPGKVVRVLATEGSSVEQGSGVVVIEAMKMQNELKSPKKGKVSKILAIEGAAVNAGDVLAVID